MYHARAAVGRTENFRLSYEGRVTAVTGLEILQPFNTPPVENRSDEVNSLGQLLHSLVPVWYAPSTVCNSRLEDFHEFEH